MEQDTIQNAAPTKLVATRMPVPEYIKFLTLAMENKMSVSDLLQYKIYQEDKAKELAKALSEAENKHKELSEELAERTEFLLGWKKTAEERAEEIEKLQNDISALKKQINAANEAEKRYRGEITADSKTITELKTRVQQLEADRKKLTDIIAQWSAKYDGLVKVCGDIKGKVLDYIKTEMLFGSDTLKNIINKLP